MMDINLVHSHVTSQLQPIAALHNFYPACTQSTTCFIYWYLDFRH